MLIRFFRKPALDGSAETRIRENGSRILRRPLKSVKTEFCFYVEISSDLEDRERAILKWLLAETFEPEGFSHETLLETPTILEVGPRLNFETQFSSSAVTICRNCGIDKVTRLERSIRYGLQESLDKREITSFLGPLHDRMTQVYYSDPLDSFTSMTKPELMREIPLIEEGIAALEKINIALGLSMDEQDLDIWYNLFVSVLKRNPTDVELFQIGQANSEHCRHGWFKGRHIIDGVELPESPMDIVRSTLTANPKGSRIGFHDNSSSVLGHTIRHLCVSKPGTPSPYHIEVGIPMNPTLTAESHNHPVGIEPFEGADTGGGGRTRDVETPGRGGLVVIGGAGYCTGNPHIPNYEMPWEKDDWQHPANLASPLEIMLRASDGASFYGNCFGEPLVYGFCRTFGMQLPDGYRSWFKPIMYSVGAGMMRDEHTDKHPPEPDMLVILLGGPGYRIGVGGGSASSMTSGTNTAELDFNSVQRGGPEMENRCDRVIHACIDLGSNNPIESVQDLGAGGTCNAIPEIVDPAGAVIDMEAIPVADPTLSKLEKWGNESQERYALLIRKERLAEFAAICSRENCPFAVVGTITGDGQLVVKDSSDGSIPVNLPLENILGKLPRKTFHHNRTETHLVPLVLPEDLKVREALAYVFRLLSVGSKRHLTNKVDRSVKGKVSQQQCVGFAHLPISDFASRADSYFGITGEVVSLGEQPIKGLIDPKAMGRLAVTEALLNMAGSYIDDLSQVKASGNWMWAAKLEGEGPRLIDTALAVRDLMITLGLAIDGGKDSLSMAAKTQSPEGKTELVKAPGQFIVALYAATSDITCKATADLKTPGNLLLHINLGNGKYRLGGSALAQTLGQIGNECPDLEDAGQLLATFNAIQTLLMCGLVKSVHDVSDGGLITTLLEMAFAGNSGLKANLTSGQDPLHTLFSEEPGVVIEVSSFSLENVLETLKGLPVKVIGKVTEVSEGIVIAHNGDTVINEPMVGLRALWEETSNRLERLQANPDCIAEQEQANDNVCPPPYRLTFNVLDSRVFASKPKVAIIREEGSNGDREMAASLILAGFDEPWDFTVSDLVSGKITLEDFRGVVFPGGFTYGDVLDSAKGWAGTIRFNPKAAEQLERFRRRPDTFSLGVCNGCQLMALLGWVPGFDLPQHEQPRFIRNRSGRFESRFPAVLINESPAIMLKGMAGAILGVWTAHGEGRLHVPEKSLLDQITLSGLAPIRYVDTSGNATCAYPANPNGSPFGIAGLCSEDGRHLAMMPHPERTTLPWQWPWASEEIKWAGKSPWLKMFENAREWCE